MWPCRPRDQLWFIQGADKERVIWPVYRIHNQTFRIGTRDTKANIEFAVNLYRLDNADNRVWKYSLKGCWLEEYSAGEMASENGSVTPSMKLSYDYFEDDAV